MKLRCHLAVVIKPQLLALLVMILKKEAVTSNDALACNNQWRLPHLLSTSTRDRINIKQRPIGAKVKSKQDDHIVSSSQLPKFSFVIKRINLNFTILTNSGSNSNARHAVKFLFSFPFLWKSRLFQIRIFTHCLTRSIV